MPISKIKTSSITADAASINLNIDANTLFLDVANNRVGVGTTSPYRQLQIGDYSTSAVMALGSSAAGTGTFCFASSDNAPGRYVGTIAYNHQANAMIFGVNAVEAARFDSNGNLGIGTTSPGSAVGGKCLTIYNTSHATLSIQAVDGGNDRSATLELLSSGNGGSYSQILYGDTDTTPGTASPLVFASYHSAVRTERMRIDANGNLLLGVNAQQYGGKIIRQDDVNSPVQSMLIRNNNAGSSSACSYVLNSYGNSWGIEMGSQARNSNALTFIVDALDTRQERMRITTAGKVGIGTSNPTAPLHVSGIVSDSLTASSSNFKLQSGGGDGIAMGSFQAAPFGSWIQSGYLVDGYNPPFNAGYPLILNPSGGGVVIGGDTSLQYGARLYVNGAIACRHSGVDGSPLPALTAGYTSNYTEKNIISTSVSSNGANSGYYFYVSDGAGSANTTLSLRVNRGSCQVIGSLSKGSGSFKIDHPLPEKENTHHLVHSFIEGPQADLIYRGKVVLVNGRADVNVDTASGMTDGTFVVLCREVQCFTTNETGWTAVRGKVTGNMLAIEAQDNTCTDEISWMVIGERQDKHMLDTGWTDENGKVIVEPLKPAENAPMSAIIPEPEEFNLDSESTSTDGE